MIKIGSWHHGQNIWLHKPYFEIPLFKEDQEELILLTLSKLETFLLKQLKSLKELDIINQNGIFICNS